MLEEMQDGRSLIKMRNKRGHSTDCLGMLEEIGVQKVKRVK